MRVVVNEQDQRGYSCTDTEPADSNFPPDFTPDLLPKQMLQMGVFGGDYFTEVPQGFPQNWLKGSRGWDLSYHRQQRQALSHWAYDSRRF